MRSYLRKYSFLIFVFLLGGCAASSVQSDFSLNSKPDQGVVIVSVSFDKEGSRNFQGTFYMDRDSDSLLPAGVQLRALREYPMMRLGSEFKDSQGQVLALALPAGKHVINSWRLERTPLYEISPKKMPPPLEFQVVAGTVQYIGNLHLNFEYGKNIIGFSTVVDVHPEVGDQHARDIPMIEKKYPQFKDKIAIALLPQGPWSANEGTQWHGGALYTPAAPSTAPD